MAIPVLSNVASLITSFNIGPLSLSRRGAPTLNAYGEYEDAITTTVVLNPVVVHNVTGRDRDNLPEAIRERENIEVYTKVRIYSGDGGQAADVLTYQGRRWTCVQTMDYALQGACWVSIFTIEDLVP